MRASEATERDFLPRALNLNPEPSALVQMSEESFKEAYAGTAFMRAGVERMKRNAAALQPDVDTDR
jgi:epoxyqueuosine reductase QueG